MLEIYLYQIFMLDTFPKISVITVCYNAAHLLKKTIESVVEQSYQEIEYIIIDGASNDNTKEFVESYGNKILIFLSEPDTGLFDAMNKGILKATGDLVIFLNAGDYYISCNVLEYAISQLKLSQAEVFFCRFIWETPCTKNIVVSDNSKVIFDWDLKSLNFPHPATIYKKDAFVKVGCFDLAYTILADYEWNVRALVKMKIPFQYVDIITVKFTADGISNNADNKTLIETQNERINNEYYQPAWIYNIFKYPEKDTRFIHFFKKVIGRFYRKRINKVY